ncbi:ECF-type sigma factor [Alienimonas californiensis]|uniref:RNA polymerase sigma factor SigM n=1 Tax=Alienimonas californiensis TaxID=2527989 RepID=A0A517P4G8_9PLAN|nr:ECF-type sigma factor [Alienimonas californiensis]QDT14277.1 RNA polymerase sigma factor SigM [Alienimonas californiensis]
MSDVTRLLDRFGAGDAAAADELLPLVYDELRRIARKQMSDEAAGHTLQATGLVHEAYLRLVRSSERDSAGDGSAADEGRIRSTRGYFFAAASEAMRRILVENARRKARLKRGGDRRRVDFDHVPAIELASDRDDDPDDLLALDAALKRFEAEHPRAASVVTLRYFAGLSFEETAAALDVSRATAVRDWTFGRAWLHRALNGNASPGDRPTEDRPTEDRADEV